MRSDGANPTIGGILPLLSRYKRAGRQPTRPRNTVMSVVMPVPDAGVLARREEIVGALRAIVPGEGVIATEREMRPYESDGLTAYRQLPMVVVLPATTAQVSGVLAYCHAHDVKVVPRGAGTSLSGGALPLGDGVLLGMAKFNRIREVDFENRVAVVEPGVTNHAVTRAVEDRGFYYAPDPSSQIACTIGGNVAENSGGVHCLKYGLTLHNVLGLRGFTIEGEPIVLGGEALDAPGYDLLALAIGSERMLVVVTEVTVKLLPKPQSARVIMASFADVEKAGDAVAKIIAGGIIPAGLEMMDKPATRAVEEFVGAGYDIEAAAILLCESDGTSEEVEDEIARMKAVLDGAGATRMTVSGDEAERLRFWSGRKAAFPAMGRISPDYYCMDGTIPRKRLGEVLNFIAALEKKYGLRCPNVFHAGDGNLHPLILFDANNADELRRTELFAGEVLEKCIEVGGTITGEHGVGVEKINQMCVQFRPDELDAFLSIKRAFDPKGLLNPGK